jgi:hypothetical protein
MMFKLGRKLLGSAGTAALMAILLSSSAVTTAKPPAQQSIVGTWVLVASDKLLPDGTRVSDYGPNPHGLTIFTSGGYYSNQFYHAERLKFASGDRANGTPDEYKSAVTTMSTSFGRYSVDPAKHTITFQRDRSSFPNNDDKAVVDPYELNGDELSWKAAPLKDGSIAITVLRRVK